MKLIFSLNIAYVLLLTLQLLSTSYELIYQSLIVANISYGKSCVMPSLNEFFIFVAQLSFKILLSNYLIFYFIVKCRNCYLNITHPFVDLIFIFITPGLASFLRYFIEDCLISICISLSRRLFISPFFENVPCHLLTFSN